MSRLIWIAVFLCFWSTHLRGADFERMVFAPSSSHERVLSGVSYFDNRKDRLPAEEILAGRWNARFIKAESMPLFIGFIKEPEPGVFWTRLDIENQHSEAIVLITGHETTPSINRIIKLSAQGKIESQERFDDKLIRTKRTYSIEPGVHTILFEMRADDFSLMFFELEIKTISSMNESNVESVVLALSYGVAIALLFYNLVLALALRTRSHFLYIGYNVGILLYYEGRYQLMAQQFGIMELPKWSLVPINTTASLFFTLFLYDMLDVPKRLPLWKRPLQIIFAISIGIIFWSFYDRLGSQVALIMMLFASGPVTVILCIHAIYKRVPASGLLTASAIMPGIGSFIHFAPEMFQHIFSWTFMKIVQMLAMDIEMVLLSMTIGYKLNKEREWLRKKIENGYAELKTIVYPHQVDMIWDGKSLPKTMPLGEAKAYVLVFDVVASSKMTVDSPRRFLSRVFSECYQMMMENYKKQPLEANAFRIKEMGDGFICSIGFPFACPTDRPAEHTVELAFRFAEIFKKHCQKLGVSGPLHCAIGLAYGPVEAFFPESGVQVYELFGRGIILAHRYEAMRDLLFRKLGHQGHIIIMSREVYQKLSPTLQNRFIELELQTAGFMVRDDEGADRLYYWIDAASTLPISVRDSA